MCFGVVGSAILFLFFFLVSFLRFCDSVFFSRLCLNVLSISATVSETFTISVII